MTQGEVATPDPLVGTVVAGKYRIIKLLGEGGMGCVYQAEQKLGTTARKVALKTLHKHLSHDQNIKDRFDREAGTIAALEHPNTIQVFDFGTMEDGTLYLVMEFVQGRSVADILEKDGPMPPERVLNIMRQVTGSLEEAHGHGIVHRDLKPDNVVLAERAGVKDWVEVLDFGIAKRSSEHDPNEAKLTQQGMVLGTPPYMSPEQFTGQPIDLRSDIYSLGVMTYEMLVGKYPFEANTAWEWASKHMTEAPRPIETQALGAHVPERMRNAIKRALEKNPAARFASVKEYYEALSGGGEPIQAAQAAALMGPPSNSNYGPPGSFDTGGGRPKTEMAAPSFGGGPPMGAMTPPYGGPMPGQGPGPGMGPAIPAGPLHQGAPEKKSGMGLIIGLGGLAAVLLIGGAIAFAMRGKGDKPVVTDPLSGIASATTSASAPVETAPVDSSAAATTLGSTAPLGAVVPPAANRGPTPANHAASIPTPKLPASQKPPEPPKADPPVCVQARDAIRRKSPIAAQLEASCRTAGGKI